jgi:hypothetical protein
MGASGFHPFEPCKKHVAGKQLAASADVKQTVTSWLQTLDINLFFAV